MYKPFILYFCFPMLMNCQIEKFHKNVGDITFDEKWDKSNFSLCDENNIYQYSVSNGLEFEGEKYAIDSIFAKDFKSKISKDENGWIQIRFIVNCNGETDRFRIKEIGRDYKEKKFSNNTISQILAITKSLKGWRIKKIDGQAIDYYQYLAFKMEEGQIKEILP